MADKPTQITLDALSRAAQEPAGLPLYAAKAAPGLFPNTAVGKTVAQRCLDDGLFQPVGRAPHYALSEKGLRHLLERTNPRVVLEDLVRAVEARQAQLDALAAATRQARADLDGLKAAVECVLPHLHAPGKPAAPPPADDSLDPDAVLAELSRWRGTGASEDCPLPALYRVVLNGRPDLTVGEFHDALRQLHDDEKVYLHPWTGPLYQLPEPAFALLVGHEVAYYASPRVRSQGAGVRSPNGQPVGCP